MKRDAAGRAAAGRGRTPTTGKDRIPTTPRTPTGGGRAPAPRPAAAVSGDARGGGGRDGRRRTAIEGVQPEVDGGRYPAKRVLGDDVVVEADVFADGHDAVRCLVLYRHERQRKWREAPTTPLPNDRWRGRFRVTELGSYLFTLVAWVDHFETWRRDLAKRVAAGQDVTVELEIGARLVDGAAARAPAAARRLRRWAARIREVATGAAARAGSAPGPPALHEPACPAPGAGRNPDELMRGLEAELSPLMAEHGDRSFATRYGKELAVRVDRERARFGAWYEFFPRSVPSASGRAGSFRDAERMIPYIAGMGFDVVYLPPVHPIGVTARKGPNNRPGGPEDPGSPWGIGSEAGGHRAVNPDLGTLDDFRRFRRVVEEEGMEVALDIAFQCSPDHPYLREHPEWFRHRPDGTIQYAENPPKKYEDIVPFDFECEAWESLWEELLGVFLFWVEQGVKIFRVDNPHTKPFPFWEWVIGRVQRRHPETIFLSEAFTRPKVMYRLAKLGFTQSYTYFAWRNTAEELTAYLTELTRGPAREFFRPSFWPNTPDILTEHLQTGGRPAFMSRLVLAATLSASYGIYGPAFELGENRPREPGSEEYLDSEKYQLRSWELERPDSLRELIARVNRIRRENPSLHRNESLRFHRTDNAHLLAYSKTDAAAGNRILVVVNLDPHHPQAGWVELDLGALGLAADDTYQVHDLLAEGRYLWQGSRNWVLLDPGVVPAHVFRIERRVRTELDFDYYM